MRAESAFLSSVLLTSSNGRPVGEDLGDEAATDRRVDDRCACRVSGSMTRTRMPVCERDLAVVVGHADFFGRRVDAAEVALELAAFLSTVSVPSR